jgi:hypothetical protein
MLAGPSIQDDENRWPVTSGHGLGRLGTLHGDVSPPSTEGKN